MEAQIRLRLTPRSGGNDFIKFEAGILHRRVTAPPVDGAANRAVIGLLSDRLGVPRSRFVFASGESSRDKKVQVTGIEPSALIALIEAALDEKRTRKRA